MSEIIWTSEEWSSTMRKSARSPLQLSFTLNPPSSHTSTQMMGVVKKESSSLKRIGMELFQELNWIVSKMHLFSTQIIVIIDSTQRKFPLMMLFLSKKWHLIIIKRDVNPSNRSRQWKENRRLKTPLIYSLFIYKNFFCRLNIEQEYNLKVKNN